MSNPQPPRIPDLRTLLPSRGGPRLRGRGRGRGVPGERFHQEDSPEVKDVIVQRTDQDAATSRVSAVELGYLKDPFARTFTPGPVTRRYPIMNRGTYVRTTAIDALVDRFLSSAPEEQKQIISLGAGSDTRYFRILSKHPTSNILYHELDFPSNTASKIATIKRAPSLLSAIRSKLHSPEDVQISPEGNSLSSSSYNIHPVDLRTLANNPPPNLPNISSSATTLILSECCLIYLTPDSSTGILRSLTEHYVPAPTPLALIVYEPIRPDDPFGRTMVANLATRGIVLETLQAHPSLASQRTRLREAGFAGGQQAADTDFLYNRWVEEKEKDRVAGLEMLDELEEWSLLAQHYCVAWGWRDGGVDGRKFAYSEAWRDLEGQER